MNSDKLVKQFNEILRQNEVCNALPFKYNNFRTSCQQPSHKEISMQKLYDSCNGIISRIIKTQFQLGKFSLTYYLKIARAIREFTCTFHQCQFLIFAPKNYVRRVAKRDKNYIFNRRSYRSFRVEELETCVFGAPCCVVFDRSFKFLLWQELCNCIMIL